MLTHAQAKQLVDVIPRMTPAKSLFCRCVSWHETNYGGGWKAGNVKRWYGTPFAWRPGVNAPWNMGAITTAHPDEWSFAHQDSKFSDEAGGVVSYVTWFAGDPTPALGFQRLVATICKQEVNDALAVNDFLGATTGMYDQHYFLGLHTHGNPNGDRQNIEDYYGAIVKAIESIGRETGESQPDVLPPTAA